MDVCGAIGSPTRNVAAKYQSEFVLTVRRASFASGKPQGEAGEAKTGRAMDNTGVLAGRRLAAYCGVRGDMQSIAP